MKARNLARGEQEDQFVTFGVGEGEQQE